MRKASPQLTLQKLICERAFQMNNIVLREQTCEDVGIGKEANPDILGLGHIILHELTHYFFLSAQVADIVINDHAYKPEPCQALAQHALNDGVPVSALTNDEALPVFNADSYAW